MRGHERVDQIGVLGLAEVQKEARILSTDIRDGRIDGRLDEGESDNIVQVGRGSSREMEFRAEKAKQWR